MKSMLNRTYCQQIIHFYVEVSTIALNQVMLLVPK